MVEEEGDKIQQALAAAERMEKANVEQKEILKKMEAIETRRILGGHSNAGEAPKPEVSEKDKIASELKQVYKGTVMERYI